MYKYSYYTLSLCLIKIIAVFLLSQKIPLNGKIDSHLRSDIFCSFADLERKSSVFSRFFRFC